MLPGDIASVRVVEELDVTPDGWTAVVVRRIIRRGEYESHLLAVSLDRRSSPRPLTAGRVRDTWPRVSPDGTRVAFLRGHVGSDDRPNELCTVSLSGGRVRRLAPRGARPGFGSISELAWSPDGTRLAIVAEVDPPRSLVGDQPSVGSRSARARSDRSPTARHITRADWRWDEEGHRDRWSHVLVVHVAGDVVVRQVTSGTWSASQVTWAPDGRTIAFVADPRDDADVRPRPTIWAVDVDAGPRSRRSRPWPVLDAAGGATHPAFGPDGRWIAGVGVLDERPLDDVSPGLLLAPVDGSQPPHALGPELDRPIGAWCDTDLHGWMVSGRHGPFWIDERTLVAVVTDRGRSLPERWCIDGAGRSVESPCASDRSAHGPWADLAAHTIATVPGTSKVAMLGTLGGRAMDVMTIDVAEPGRRIRRHSTIGSAWQRRFVQPEMRRLDAPGAGGPIETWVASPPGAGDAALPTIVDVHGGPLGGWAPAPHIEVTQLVGAGYRVVLPNIRGGQGYGRAWIRPQLGDWGGVDADDVHAAVDHVVALGLADPDRLGIMGLSYGGFMVNWLVGTSGRFRAAVSENGVTNQLSTWANSDFGPEYCRMAELGDTLSAEGVERLWRQSPLRHVANVRTPLLMLQAEADLRCPPQDNEQLFVALRHLGREVEYVLYPDEHHTFSSTGRPDRRIDRMERVLDWFGTHL